MFVLASIFFSIIVSVTFLLDTMCKTETLCFRLTASACLLIKSPFVGNTIEGNQPQRNKMCFFLSKKVNFIYKYKDLKSFKVWFIFIFLSNGN